MGSRCRGCIGWHGRAAELIGASADVNLPLLPLVVDPTPDTGPIRTARASTTNTPCQAELATIVLTAKALCPNVTTTLNPGTSTATSTVADATIAVPGIPLIGVSGAKANSFSSCTATSGSSTLTLTIAGTPVTVPTAPNSVLDLGVAKLIVNEQHPVPGADFGTIVNAVHLTGLGGTVDVVLASATSDAHNCG